MRFLACAVVAARVGAVSVRASTQVSRRGALIFGGGAASSGLAVPWLARAEEGAAFTALKLEAGSVEVPETWKRTATGLEETVLGAVTDEIEATRAPTSRGSIKDFAKTIDVFPMAELRLNEKRTRGDIVAARQRTDLDGTLFYEWDLAVAPLDCPESQQLTRTTCLPDEVILVSACVRDGQLVVFHTATGRQGWKNFGKALRLVRSSFVAAPTSP